MARQCRPIGLIWLVTYNQSNFYRFWGKHLVIGQFGFSVFFICQSTGSKPTRTEQNGSSYWIGQDCASTA